MASNSFIEWYRRLWGDGPGDAIDEVTAAEHRLGVSMPPLLREVYLHTSLRSSQMLHLERLANVTVRDSLLVFAREQQACYHWGLRVAGSICVADRVLVELQAGWQDEGCSLDEFLRFFALCNRPYEPPSCEVDFDPDRLRPPWRLHRVEWLNIQHELWSNGEAVLEEGSSRLGARDQDALGRAAASLGVDPDDLDEDAVL